MKNIPKHAFELCSTTHHFLQKIRRKEENEIYVSKNSKE
jgi:hypothetical protein